MDKTRKRLTKELFEIEYFKWQFLRRNRRYIKDCERWSGRPKAKWDEREIILGYPYKGNLTHLNAERFEQFHNDVEKYRQMYWDEWGTFNDHLALIESLKGKGLRPIESKKSGTWREYSQEWLINLPLNPKVEYRPHFVEIAPVETITEVMAMSLPRKVFMNDMLLEEGDSSFIKVNWAAPSAVLIDKFKRMITDKKSFLKMQGRESKDVRPRLDLYAKYLKIWNLRKEKKGYLFIAQEVYPGIEKSPSAIREAFLAAQALIDGGYKTIG